MSCLFYQNYVTTDITSVLIAINSHLHSAMFLIYLLFSDKILFVFFKFIYSMINTIDFINSKVFLGFVVF